MARGFDWPALMAQALGRGGLGLTPEQFWRLTPAELRLMLGLDAGPSPLTRARLAELAAAFPDASTRKEPSDDGQ